jgi:hypothetical protein
VRSCRPRYQAGIVGPRPAEPVKRSPIASTAKGERPQSPDLSAASSAVEQKSSLSENIKKSAVRDAGCCQPVEVRMKLRKAGTIADRLLGGQGRQREFDFTYGSLDLQQFLFETCPYFKSLGCCAVRSMSQ